MAKIYHTNDRFDGHRIVVKSDRLDADELVFQFTHEGIIIDAVKDGEVMGTECRMYDEIEGAMSGV